MNKITKLFLLMFFTIIFLGCLTESEKHGEKMEKEWVYIQGGERNIPLEPVEIKFFKHKKTGICFAAIYGIGGNGTSEISFTYIPCRHL